MRLLSFLVIWISLSAQANPKAYLIGMPEGCEEGECIQDLINEYEGIEKLAYKEGCLPSGEGEMTEREIESFFESAQLDETCIDRLTKMNQLSGEINRIATLLETAEASLQESCYESAGEAGELVDASLFAVADETENMCTPEKKAEKKANCKNDIKCAVQASIKGSLAKIPGFKSLDSNLTSNCHADNDNCLYQIATGFIKASWAFITGTWDLLKMGAKAIKNGVISGWNRLWGIEDRSSDAQNALAEGSEDESLFQAFLADPIGSIKKGFSALLDMLKDWLKNDAFCQKWSGLAHYSECIEPAQGLDCLSCKAMINGGCYLVGTVLSEITPSFLFGLAINGARLGVKLGSKLGDSFKVAQRLREMAKNSKLVQSIKTGSGKKMQRARESLENSQRYQRISENIADKIKRIKDFLGSASRLKNAKAFDFMKTKQAYLFFNGTKKSLVFTKKALKLTGKIVLYPIENPLTTRAFSLGMNLGRKPLVSGGIRGLVAGEGAMKALDSIDESLIEFDKNRRRLEEITLRQARGKAINQDEFRLLLKEFELKRKNYLKGLAENRFVVLDDFIHKSDVTFSEVIDDLFPELKYSSEFSQGLKSKQLKRAEVQLQSYINRIDDVNLKIGLQRQFDNYRATPSRAERNIDHKIFYSDEEITQNASLRFDHERSSRAKEVLEQETFSARQERALIEAYEIGLDAGATVYTYTPAQIMEKYRTLRSGGFSSQEADRLIRSGLVGGLRRSDDALKAQDEYFSLLKSNARNLTDASTQKINQYEKFLEQSREEISRALKVDDLKPHDLDFDKFNVIQSQKTGEKFVAIETTTGRYHVFSLNQRRLGPMLGNRSDLGALVGRQGDIFDLDNGMTLKFENGFGTKIHQVVPNNASAVNRIFDTLNHQADQLGSAMAQEYRDFLRIHADNIQERLLKAELTIDDLSPVGFKTAMDPETELKYFINGNQSALPSPKEPYAFSADGVEVKSLSEIRERPYTLVFNDGSARRFTQDSRLEYFPAAYTDEWIESNKIFKPAASNATFKQMMQENEEFLRLKIKNHELDPKQLDWHNPTILRKGQDQYFVIQANPIEESLVLKFEAKDKQQLLRLKSLIPEIGDSVRLNSGMTVRSYRVGDNVRFSSSNVSGKSSKMLLRDLRADYQVLTKTDQGFAEHVEFLTKYEESIIKITREQSGFPINIFSPEHVHKAKIHGEDFYMVSALGNHKSPPLFIAASEKLPSGLSRQDYYTWEEIRLISNKDILIRTADNLEMKINPAGTIQEVQIPRNKSVFSTYEKIQNSKLSLNEKIYFIQKNLNRELSIEEVNALETILTSKKLETAGMFNYSTEELDYVNKILKDGGFSKSDRQFLKDSGLAARPPTKIVQDSNAFFAESFDRLSRRSYGKEREEVARNIRTRIREDDANVFDQLQYAIQGRSSRLSVKEAETILDNLDALYFIDYQHYSKVALDMLDGKTQFHKTKIYSRYNSATERPFENFKQTMRWMEQDLPDISLDTFKQTHSSMMANGVENLSDTNLGVSRGYEAIGRVTEGQAVSDDIVQNIKDNPYTIWQSSTRQGDGRNTGYIIYPNVDRIKPAAINRIRKVDSQLANKIEEYTSTSNKLTEIQGQINKIGRTQSALEEKVLELQAKFDLSKGAKSQSSKIYQELNQARANLSSFENSNHILESQLKLQRKRLIEQLQTIGGDKVSLNQKLLDTLTEERIQWFNRKRKELGSLDRPEKLDEFVDLVAEFQRDLVSIHPFGNGNGRTTRQFGLYYPLMREGLPPPRILDPNNDIYRSLSDWKTDIKQGVLASQNLMDDLLERSRTGMPVEASADLIAPVDRSRLRLDMYRDNTKIKWVEAPELEDLNVSQYREFLRRAIEEQPVLRDEIISNPTLGWEKANTRAMQLYRENNLYYDYRRYGKSQIERLRQGVPDQDFLAAYGNHSYKDLSQYHKKMDDFYSEEVLWRGWASPKGQPVQSDEDIARFFKEFSNRMSSNRTLAARSTDPIELERLARQEFEELRKAIYNDPSAEANLVEIASRHSEAIAPYYGNSIAYSTSKSEKVGTDFAMGAMVYGDYKKLPGDKVSEYLKPENQARIGQRLLVGERRSHIHTDLTRLKKLRSEFSYKFFRQNEVLGYGTGDPDAISIIKIISEDRKIIKSYVRDPDQPYLIHVVEGNAKEGVLPDNIVKTIDLREKTL